MSERSGIESGKVNLLNTTEEGNEKRVCVFVLNGLMIF